MVGYFADSGLVWYYPMSEGRTGFICQTALLENFNTTPLIVNASYFRSLQCWGATEVHLTRLWLIYIAAAANTIINASVATGNKPAAYILVPACELAATAAGFTHTLDSEEMDIPIEPTGQQTGTSYAQFILIALSAYNLADDCAVIFQGWYRTLTKTDAPMPTPVVLDGIKSWSRRF